MRMFFPRFVSCVLVLWTTLAVSAVSAPAQSLITAPIAESNLTRLPGNTRPEAKPENDRGLVPDAFPMRHMLLQLRRPPAQEHALEQFMKEQQDPASPNYQHWLTADEFGAQYGPSTSDIRAVSDWLASRGFAVDAAPPSGMTIGFSGTAGQVRAAFHTEIHHILARGALHFANMSDPLIPSALAPAVVGIASLHDIGPRPQISKRGNYSFGSCSLGSTCYAVTPPDLATIYNFNPVFAAKNTGQKQTIYLIEDSDLYATADWTTFRATFGLAKYSAATLSTVQPQPKSGASNCTDPGVNDASDEATLDAEYASAAAPSAKIVMATCKDDGVTFGGLTALQNLIDNTNPPKIISLSYGDCETDNGAANNAAYNTIFQQGAAEGASIFVSSGDQEAGGCNYDAYDVTAGIAVNGFASTPYNVAVGGTDFSDTYAQTNSVYWNASNTAVEGSARSYIPEIPWNSSCASQLFATYYGFPTTYGASGFCNSSKGRNDFLNNAGGSGGPSACATGAPSITIYGGFQPVSGSCAGNAKPSWQTGVPGIPNDGVRDLPDVSLFAADGPWDHYFVYCYSDTKYGGRGCTGSPSDWDNAGGTSFSSPIMAGIQALINEKTGLAAGNPNPRLYALAAAEFGTGGGACNSSLGVYQSPSCIFHNVTQGDMNAPCVGTYNCYLPSGSYGVLSTSDASYAPAYQATPGWSFATGLGSVNVANLVANWKTVSTHWWIDGVGGFFGGKDGNGVVWRDRANGKIATWELDKTTKVAAGAGQTVADGLTIAGVGDFFASGRSDSFLWLNTSTGEISTWQMNGVKHVATGGGQIVAANQFIAGVGDFFASGHNDSILLLNAVTGQITTWQLKGSALAATGGGQILAANLAIAGIGDFFNSGRLDSLLLRNTATGQITTWELNGVTQVATGGGQTLADSWTVAGVGDFFKTGHANSILWRNTATGQITTWELNGVTQVATGGGQTQANAWIVAGVGNYFATGRLDSILWRNAKSGEITTWEMDGAKKVATGGGLTLP